MSTDTIIHQLMQELSQLLHSLNPQIVPKLQPAASTKQIQRAEKKLAISFPEELRALLSCCNGQQIHADGAYADPIIPSIRYLNGLYSYYWLASIEDIIENTLQLREDYNEYLQAENFAITGPTRNHAQFLPFTVTENADILVLDLNPDANGKIGQVVMLCTQPCELVVIADSLANFLRLLIDGYHSGRYKFNSDEHFVLYAEN